MVAIVLTDSLKKLLIETASQLKGAAKRFLYGTDSSGLRFRGTKACTIRIRMESRYY
jgi:hypothetical protein